MKTAFFSLLALPALLLGVIAAPAQVENTVATRAESRAAQAAAIIAALDTEVKKYTADINSTADSITPSSTAAQKAAAAKEVNANIQSIDNAIYAANNQIIALSTPKISGRQSQAEVDAAAVEQGLMELFLEIGDTLKRVTGVLSGQSLDLTTLPNALYGLVSSLGNVVAGILGMLETGMNALNIALADLIPNFPV